METKQPLTASERKGSIHFSTTQDTPRGGMYASISCGQVPTGPALPILLITHFTDNNNITWFKAINIICFKINANKSHKIF